MNYLKLINSVSNRHEAIRLYKLLIRTRETNNIEKGKWVGILKQRWSL